MAKVYIFLAEGFEEIEALTVVDLLRRVGIDIMTISVTGEAFVTGSHQITVKADTLFEDANFSDADLLVLPGGMPGTKNLGAHEGLVDLLKDFGEKNKRLAAICAAPIVLGANGILKGRKVTSFPGYEEELIGARIKNADVVEDGNIITSKGMGTAIDFSLALIKNLLSEAEAVKIAKTIQYKR